jgi:hypothetical protein
VKRYVSTHLEGPSDPEHAVVGFLGREPLQRELDGVVFFGDEVVASGESEDLG